METWKHIRTAIQLFSTSVIRYLAVGAVVAYGSLFTFGLLAGPLIGGFVNLGLVHHRTGRPPGLGDLISGFQNLGNLFLLSLLLISCGVGVGVVLPALMVFVWWAYIPLLILLVSLVTWWMYVPALIVDKRMSIWGAMRESRARVTTRNAVINSCDDVRSFAGCLTGRRDWPLQPAEKITGQYLSQALAHTEVELLRLEDDETRPKLFCKAVHSVNHAPFQGFNRAQHSVLEAAILVSRLDMLSWDKIEAEIEYLSIGFYKTAGDREKQAWDWLMTAVEKFKTEVINE